MTNKETINFFNFFSSCEKETDGGFSLIEVMIALVILLISILGIFAVFTYATIYNAGNGRRSQALSVFQQQIELIRSAKFTPTIYNDPLLTGGVKTPVVAPSEGDKGNYLIETVVDNDPFTSGVQTANDSTTTLKEITITVTPRNTNGSWVTAFPTRVVLRRNRAN